MWRIPNIPKNRQKIQYPSLATATKSHGHTAFSSPILSPILCYFEANHKLAISGLSWKPGSVLLGKSLHIAESLSPHWQSAGDC